MIRLSHSATTAFLIATATALIVALMVVANNFTH
jgi:hypothetical protein